MARVDFPAPRSPVRTMEASESKTLAVENSGECGGELGAEREAVCPRQQGLAVDGELGREADEHNIPLEGEPAGVGGEGSYALTI